MQVLVVAAAVGLVWMVRRRGLSLSAPRAHGRAAPSRAAALYCEAVGALGRLGYVKSPCETPEEFCAKVARKGGGHGWLPVLVELTELYQRIRFGGMDSAGGEGAVRRGMERIERLVGDLKRVAV